MSTTNNLIEEIKKGSTQTSASSKDELRVMQAMLNDKEYAVDVYTNKGIEQYYPSQDARTMLASAIASAVKISKDEANALADAHEFTKNEASTFINVSKEFVNTYLETGRKLPLGGRADSNVALTQKQVPAKETKALTKTGTDGNGKDIYESVPTGKTTPAHKSIKVSGSCPKWKK